MDKIIFSVNNVSVFLNNSCVLEDVNFTVDQFDYIGMIGPNGVITSYSIHYTKLYDSRLHFTG